MIFQINQASFKIHWLKKIREQVAPLFFYIIAVGKFFSRSLFRQWCLLQDITLRGELNFVIHRPLL